MFWTLTISMPRLRSQVLFTAAMQVSESCSDHNVAQIKDLLHFVQTDRS